MNEKEILRLEVFNKLSVRRLSQSDVASLLSISKRQVKRLSKRYKSQGAKGLESKKRGKRSNNRLSEDLKNQVISLISEKYEDFGPTFAHEKLVEQEGLRLSVTSTRNLMIDCGIWISKKSKKKRVFQMRQRRPREGEIVQVDGSDHLWFENRGKRCTLLVYIDDATSNLKELRFVESESIFSYYKATKSYLKKHGRPLSFYTDKHSVFRVNREGALSGTGLTQFGHAMKRLDIKLLYANTPQAKGRVERSNRVLQDRLVKQLRLLDISTMEQANAYLPTFIEDYNKRFSVAAKNPENAHRPLLDSHDLERIFTIKNERCLSKNLTLQYKNTLYQIVSDRQSYTLRHTQVTVSENDVGNVRIFYKDKELKYSTHDFQEKQGIIVDSKHLNQEFESIIKKPKNIPAKHHPCRKISGRRPVFSQ